MSQMLTGSVCFTDLKEALKKAHSSGSKAGNGKIYANIVIWVNDEPDKLGNTVSIQLNSTKDKRDEEGKVYIGNAKPMAPATPEPVSSGDIEDDDDLPF